MNIAHHLSRIAQLDGQRPALFRGTRQHSTYAQWVERVQQLASSLRQMGLKPGDCVALYLHNCLEYLDILYAAWWAGLVVVPINAKLHPKEAEWIAIHSESAAVFTSSDMHCAFDLIERVVDIHSPHYRALFTQELLPLQEREADDLAWLFYTSGTTGQPKGVMLTHKNLTMMGLSYFAGVDAPQMHDTHVYCAPMSHGAGMYAIPHVMAGARHCVPDSGGFEPFELFGLSQHMPSLTLFAAPTMVKRLVDFAKSEHTRMADWSGFKTIVYGGGPMYLEDILSALQHIGAKFVQIYGQGECPMTISSLSREMLVASVAQQRYDRVASVGLAQAAVQLRIADTHGNAVPAGEVGEIQVRGDLVMAGYWRNEMATQAAIKDGWLSTGDMGCLDVNGFLTLKDRSKDVIISGGSNIYPREVEEILLKSNKVREVSVLGEPDPEWGEVVVAFVVLNQASEHIISELDQLCLAHIARFKRPKKYHFIDELPKNNYGKVLKTALRNHTPQPQ